MSSPIVIPAIASQLVLPVFAVSTLLAAFHPAPAARADDSAEEASRAGNSAAPPPLARAHAHNDYEHPRPLADALAHGFCSVEADIHLVDGRLLVAHDLDRTDPARTLEALYLDPLLERVRSNGGRVLRGGPIFTLLIDVKSEAESTYRALARALTPYRSLMKDGAVSIVVSGNRAKEAIAADPDRLVGIDGRLEDLARPASDGLMPLISDRWTSHFQWNGAGPMPAEEREKLHRFVEQAHRNGRRIRFWATLESPALWQELIAADVDLINTDNLPALAEFLRGQPLN